MMSDKVSKSIEEALAQLHDERERIEGAIAKLEGFLGNLSGAKALRSKSKNRIASALRKAGTRRRVVAKVRSRAGWTEDARKAAAERMRKYWAEQHKSTTDSAGKSRRGRRSTKATTTATRSAAKERSRKGWTEDARQAAAERMRKYWEDRKSNKVVTG